MSAAVEPRVCCPPARPPPPLPLLSLLLLLLALASPAPARAAPPAAYARCRVLDCATNTTLSWTLDAARSRLLARVATLRAAPDGYVALGLSAGGANPMVGSGAAQPTDFWVFAAPTAANGNAASAPNGSALDASGASYAPPTLDAAQDLALEAPAAWAPQSQARGTLSFDFSRALTTAEAAALGADRAVPASSAATTLVWALGEGAGAVDAY